MHNRYRAFICYSQQDDEEAARLHRQIESFSVPRRLRGVEGKHGPMPNSLAPVFRDRDELAASADIGERLRDALARSDFLIVLCSPFAARSKWVNAEIETFCTLAPGNRERVLAVLLRGEPISENAATECFPAALLESTGAKTLFTRYPLAADFRRGKERRADAELRLFAALLGVEFDVLKQREQERRVGRLRLALGLALASIVGFASLTGYAFSQRAAARAAALRAQNASERATLARDEAEKMVEYVLGDLRTRLAVIGKQELLEPTHEKVRAYYEKLPPDETDVAALRRQAAVFFLLGVDADFRKRRAETMEALERSARLRQRVCALTPQDPVSWQDLAESHRWLALRYRDYGEIESALGEMATARRFATRGAALDSTNIKSAVRVASLAMDEADLFIRAGRSAEALSCARSSYTDLAALLPRDPTNKELKNRASAAAWQLGNVLRRAGKFTEAESLYRQALEWADQLCAAQSGNIFALRRRELAAGSLGQLYLEADRYAEAERQLQSAELMAREILATEPANIAYQDMVATNLANRGAAEMRLEKLPEAEMAIGEAVALREQALKNGAEDMRTLNALALALASWSEVACLRNDFAAAVDRAQRGVTLSAQLTSAHPADVRLADDCAYLRSKLAKALQAGAKFSDAEAEYRLAIAQIEAVIGRDKADPQLLRWRDHASWQVGLASALHGASRDEECRAALEAGLATFARLARGGLPEPDFAAYKREAEALLARLTANR